jgi:uncharacterized RDD family membrane protein YckC
MSSTPPEPPGPDQPSAPIPVGYSPGDYVPFADRDPSNPSSIAGQWADPARQAQTGVGPPMTEEQRYRAIYGYDAPMRITLASWGHRVLGYLVDTFVGLVASIPLIVGYVMLAGELDVRTDAAGNSALGPNSDVSVPTIGMLVLGAALSLVFNIYNTIIRQGRTGYSFGKAAVGIRLLKESTGQPMGAGLCFVRQLAHYVDSLVCYLGWLWPLWDAKKQTLADKIMGTVVVVQSPDSAR